MISSAMSDVLERCSLAIKLHEDWRLISSALLFALGCAVAFTFDLPDKTGLVSVIMGVVLVLAIFAAAEHWKSPFVLSALFFLGTGIGELHKDRLPNIELERETFVDISGHIQSVEHRIAAPLRLRISVVESDKLQELAGEDVQISVRTDYPFSLATGNAVTFSAILEPHSGPMVPGGFDFALNHRFKGIALRGFAVSPIEIHPTMAPNNGFFTRLANYRNNLSERILSTLSQPTSGVAVALITGQRQHLDRTTANILRDAGLAHLLAISGLHMGLITGVAFFLLEFLLAAVPGFALRYPTRKLAALGAWATAVVYLLLSGAGISTLRAFVMVSVALLAVVTDRRVLSLRSVALAAMAILALSPQAILSISFQMSFAATIGLIVFYGSVSRQGQGRQQSPQNSTIQRRIHSLARFVAATALTSLVAQVAIAPIALFHFQALSVIGILANILAVPLMAFIVMPAAFLSLVLIPLGLDALLLGVMSFGLEWIIDLSSFLIEFPLSVIRAGPFFPEILLVTFLLFASLMLIRLQWIPLAISLLFVVAVVLMQKSTAVILIDNEGRIIAAKSDSHEFRVIGGRRSGFRDEIWMRYWNMPLSAPTEKLDRNCNDRGCITNIPAPTEIVPNLIIVRSFSMEVVRSACNAGQIVIAPMTCSAIVVTQQRSWRSRTLRRQAQ